MIGGIKIENGVKFHHLECRVMLFATSELSGR